MTAEPDRMMRPPGARIVFAAALAPLPLADPSEAARFLKVKRHTLACYRNLGGGPPYYKFGRWIRYAWTDLRRWAGADCADDVWIPPEFQDAIRAGALLLVDAPTAARFLTLTRFCLANYRAEGDGPPFCRFGRRIHYPIDELCRWARCRHRLVNRPGNALPGRSRV